MVDYYYANFVHLVLHYIVDHYIDFDYLAHYNSVIVFALEQPILLLALHVLVQFLLKDNSHLLPYSGNDQYYDHLIYKFDKISLRVYILMRYYSYESCVRLLGCSGTWPSDGESLSSIPMLLAAAAGRQANQSLSHISSSSSCSIELSHQCFGRMLNPRPQHSTTCDEKFVLAGEGGGFLQGDFFRRQLAREIKSRKKALENLSTMWKGELCCRHLMATATSLLLEDYCPTQVLLP